MDGNKRKAQFIKMMEDSNRKPPATSHVAGPETQFSRIVSFSPPKRGIFFTQGPEAWKTGQNNKKGLGKKKARPVTHCELMKRTEDYQSNYEFFDPEKHFKTTEERKNQSRAARYNEQEGDEVVSLESHQETQGNLGNQRRKQMERILKKETNPRKETAFKTYQRPSENKLESTFSQLAGSYGLFGRTSKKFPPGSLTADQKYFTMSKLARTTMSPLGSAKWVSRDDRMNCTATSKFFLDNSKGGFQDNRVTTFDSELGEAFQANSNSSLYKYHMPSIKGDKTVSSLFQPSLPLRFGNERRTNSTKQSMKHPPSKRKSIKKNSREGSQAKSILG